MYQDEEKKFTVSTCLFISYDRLVFKYPKFKLHFFHEGNDIACDSDKGSGGLNIGVQK